MCTWQGIRVIYWVSGKRGKLRSTVVRSTTTVPSSQSPPTVSCRSSTLEKPPKIWNSLRHLKNNEQLVLESSLVCRVSNKMKPSFAFYPPSPCKWLTRLRHDAALWVAPTIATTYPFHYQSFDICFASYRPWIAVLALICQTSNTSCACYKIARKSLPISLIRLLQRKLDSEIAFRKPTSSDIPAYAILSYT